MLLHVKPSRLIIAAVAVVVVAVAAVIVVRNMHKGGRPLIVSQCTAGPATPDPAVATYTLDLEQAANAGTISAIGKRIGMPDHAVTVALATALQESKLRNVAHGDLDSLGLFQQRPSQGWGSSAQVMDPNYATVTFFQHLTKVKGWETLAVADAAQSVQHSASGDAYAQWEPEARTLAAALTGEVAGGLTCQWDPSSAGGTGTPGQLSAAMAAELGAPAIGVAVPAARGWMVAGWLVTHAAQYRIASVSFAGKTWSPAGGTWAPDPAAGSQVQITTLPVPR